MQFLDLQGIEPGMLQGVSSWVRFVGSYPRWRYPRSKICLENKDILRKLRGTWEKARRKYKNAIAGAASSTGRGANTGNMADENCNRIVAFRRSIAQTVSGKCTHDQSSTSRWYYLVSHPLACGTISLEEAHEPESYHYQEPTKDVWWHILPDDLDHHSADEREWCHNECCRENLYSCSKRWWGLASLKVNRNIIYKGYAKQEFRASRREPTNYRHADYPMY